MPLKSKQPRITLPTPPYDSETQSVLELLGPELQLFRAFAARPERARGIAGWGSYYLSRRLALSVRQRELVIDRTTARCGADYEWGIHVAVFAQKAGLAEAEVASLATGSADDPCWIDPADRAVIAAVDTLHETNDLDDATWDRLVAAVGEDGAVDLVLLAGWYHAISYVARALRLPMEPATTGLPAR
jgi:alkylhydroperoxidase family enzyme